MKNKIKFAFLLKGTLEHFNMGAISGPWGLGPYHKDIHSHYNTQLSLTNTSECVYTLAARIPNPNFCIFWSQAKMTRMRQRIAQRLKDSQNTYAMLTTFNEVDMRLVFLMTVTNLRYWPDVSIFHSLHCSLKYQCFVPMGSLSFSTDCLVLKRFYAYMIPHLQDKSHWL